MDSVIDNLETVSKIKLKLTYGDPIDIKTVYQRVNICNLKVGENNIIITCKKILRLFRNSNLYGIFKTSLIITYGGLSEVTIIGGDFTPPPNTQYPDSDSSYESDSSDSSDSYDNSDSSDSSSSCYSSDSSDSSDSSYDSESCYSSDTSDSSDISDSLSSCYESDI